MICPITINEYEKTPKYLMKAIKVSDKKCLPPCYEVRSMILDSDEELHRQIESGKWLAITIYTIAGNYATKYTKEDIDAAIAAKKELIEKEQYEKLKEKYEN